MFNRQTGFRRRIYNSSNSRSTLRALYPLLLDAHNNFLTDFEQIRTIAIKHISETVITPATRRSMCENIANINRHWCTGALIKDAKTNVEALFGYLTASLLAYEGRPHNHCFHSNPQLHYAQICLELAEEQYEEGICRTHGTVQKRSC